MQRRLLKGWFIVMIGAIFVGCAAQQKPGTDFKPYVFPKGEYVQKVDHFLVVLDASSSMGASCQGQIKMVTAKEFLCRMNRTIPDDLKLTGGIRTFGQNICPFAPKTQAVYGLTEYSKQAFGEALAPIRCAGVSPMASALNAAGEDFRSKQGQIALIAVSDGMEEYMEHGKALEAARSLKSQYGERLCIYTVLVGDDAKGTALMDQLAKIGACGFSVNAAQVSSSQAMADFVEKVFLAKVPKKVEAPPPAPPPAAPPAPVKPKDSDFDGVYDDRDFCPGTPLGAKVDAKGCWNIENVLFDTDKSKIKGPYVGILNEVVLVMKKNPALKLMIQGHTDSVGTAKYNRGLSERRAKAVMDYFVKEGIGQDRLSMVGYGLTSPTATNLTKAGRALNRRVELHPSW